MSRRVFSENVYVVAYGDKFCRWDSRLHISFVNTPLKATIFQLRHGAERRVAVRSYYWNSGVRILAGDLWVRWVTVEATVHE